MATGYTAANVLLSVTPDLTGFGADIDRQLARYVPKPVDLPINVEQPRPVHVDVDADNPEIRPTVDTTRAESRLSDGMKAGAIAAAAVCGVAFGKAFVGALDLTAVRGRMVAQLGGGADIEKAGKVATLLYTGVWVDSAQEGSDLVVKAMQDGLISVGQTAEEQVRILSGVSAVAQQFGLDNAEVLNAAGQLIRTGVAPDMAAATDMIVAGFQNGLNRSGDFLETLTQFSPTFGKLGLSGAGAMTLLSGMMQAGVKDSDVAATALEELADRGVAGGEAINQAWQILGLNGAKIQADLAAGGDRAAGATMAIFDAMGKVKDPTDKATAGAALFGEAWVVSGDALGSIDTTAAATKFDDLAGGTDRVRDSTAGVGATFEGMQRTLQQSVVDFIAANVIPPMTDLLGVVNDLVNTPGVPELFLWLVGAGLGLAGIMLAVQVATMAWTTATTIWSAATAISTAAQWLWNSAMLANPIVWVVGILALLVGAFIVAYNSSEDFRNIVNGALRAVGEFFVWVFENLIKPPFDAFVRFIGDVARGLGIEWDKVVNIFKAPINFVITEVWNKGVGGLWRAADGFFGGALPDWHDATPLADGGRVGGSSPHRRADNIPAMLTAGEYVQPVDAAQYYGVGVMDAMRRREIPREQLAYYALGGPVTPEQELGVLRGAFPGVRLTSGYRPGAPGYHGQDKAGDFAGPRSGDAAYMMRIDQWIAQNYPRSGELIYTPGINLKNGSPHTYSGAVRADHYDHVHWANLGGLGGAGGSVGSNFSGSASGTAISSIEQLLRDGFDGLADTARALVPAGDGLAGLPRGVLETVIGGARTFLFGEAKKKDEATMAVSAGSGGAGVQQWTGVVGQALGMLGLSPTLVGITLRRMNQESGGNPRAINNWDSNAKKGVPSKGLMQVIDPTFNANWDPRTPHDIWNPLSNIVASMKYALGRYGNLPAAYGRAGGYDGGGELFPGITQVTNATGRSETVVPLPPDVVAAFARGSGGRGPVQHVDTMIIREPVDVDAMAQRLEFLAGRGGM